jgi:hypothetical protein
LHRFKKNSGNKPSKQLVRALKKKCKQPLSHFFLSYDITKKKAPGNHARGQTKNTNQKEKRTVFYSQVSQVDRKANSIPRNSLFAKDAEFLMNLAISQ